MPPRPGLPSLAGALAGPARRLGAALRRVAIEGRPAPPDGLGALKVAAIDRACDLVAARSLADLGGVWAVDGGYAFHAAARPAVTRVALVDEDFTSTVVERAGRDGVVELVGGNFGDPAIAARVGEVDIVLLFDVLLHQVRPDWDDVLDLYAARTRCFVIVQPTYAEAGPAVRLLDLGVESYLALVPDVPIHQEALARLDEPNERRGKPWRDVHDIWQWGIGDAALRAKLGALGFELAHHESAGRWRGLEHFDDSAYVFVRPGARG
ncbi:MAG: hypothetical protein ACR2KV_17670 [Solirubrobacteraceae bacterium]